MNHFDGTAPVLHHLCLQSESPERLVEFYTQVMGYRFVDRDSCSIGHGAKRTLIIEAGTSKTLGYSAYSVPDDATLEDLRHHIHEQGVNIDPSPSALFGSNAFAVRDPDNNTVVFGTAPDIAHPPSATNEIAPRPAGNRDPRPVVSLPGRLQHIVVATENLTAMIHFYHDQLGFGIADKVVAYDGDITACFFHTDDEHHSFAAFRAPEARLDHHCYDVAEWNLIRDWTDHFARFERSAMWGPGRHGVGNNLFAMFKDPDGNWIEVSAELETITPQRDIGEWQHTERALNLWGRAILRS